MIHQTAFQKVVALRDLADNLRAEIKQQRDRADRAERILGALREPSEAVVDAATEAFADYDDMRHGVRAAVAAAEREVDA